MTEISPMSYVDKTAKIGKNVRIGPFAYIDKDVIIGDDTVIMPHVSILYGTTLGHNNKLFPGVVIGSSPQNLRFKGESTSIEIGDHNVIRENVIINRGTIAKKWTLIGNHNLFMAGVHISHDVVIRNNCRVGHSSKISGETMFDDYVIVGDHVSICPQVRVGSYVTIRGGSRLNRDVPPFLITKRGLASFSEVNKRQLLYCGFDEARITSICAAYAMLYKEQVELSDVLKYLCEAEPFNDDIRYIVHFIEHSKKGIIR